MLLFILAFLGGVLTISSPCILPVLPFVFTRAGVPFVRGGLPLLAGMALTFAAVASLTAVGGGWAVSANQLGRWIALALMLVFGLALLLPSVADRLMRPVVALGNRIAGLMGDDDLVAQVRSAADAVGEPVWPMPLPDDLKALLKSDVADLANTKLGTVVPGMLLAGVFLQQFVGRRDEADEARIPWAHVDIAGPSFNSGSPWGFTGSGATGAAVRTLVKLGEQFAAR